ncbi:MAG: redoxin domain-containing protein [Deltaproteobacteria bacterium]|nr:redoxin domain-containing protein [Deltaproteobacteria bacterium]
MHKLTIAVILLGLILCRSAGAETSAAMMVAAKFTDISFLTDGGKKIKLVDVIRGFPAVVNFTTPWCMDCKHLAEALRKIAPGYLPQNVRFYNIYLGVKQKYVGRLQKGDKQVAGATMLLDPDRSGSQTMGVSGIPHVFVFDAAGKLNYEKLFPKEKELKKAIDKVVR